MCGIVGFVDRTGRQGAPTGTIVLGMLEALACRGPDGAGIALIRDPAPSGHDGAWEFRVAPLAEASGLGESAGTLGRLGEVIEAHAEGDTVRYVFRPNPGVAADDLERALGRAAGGWSCSASARGSTWSSRWARRRCWRRPTA